MPHSYVGLDTFKGTGALNVTGTAYDSRLLVLLENVTKGVDEYTGRTFQYFIGTRHYDGGGTDFLMVQDLVAVSTLLEDTNRDGTFETGWATADYLTWPYNADPTSTWGGPYTRLVVNKSSNGTQDTFLDGQRNYRLVGTFGFWKVTKASGRLASGTLDSTSTSLVLNGTVGGTIEAGNMLLLDDELMYVSSGTASAGTAVTVQRAIYGSTATSHSTSSASLVLYPGAVQEAVLIQAARLWKRKDSAFGNQIGFPETGQIVVFGGLDPDVKQMLNQARIRRLAI